jgi:transposase-like protein
MSLIKVYATFGTDEACIAYLKAARWPDGVKCLRCGSDKVAEFRSNETEREITDDQGNVTDTQRVPSRHLFQCNNEGCRFQFSATAGTIFDKSHLPLSVWFQAIALMVNARKGLSAKQMERDLGVNYRTAWFLNHRIREAMQSEAGLFGGEVEIDETYIGGKYDPRRKRARREKPAVMGLIQRGTPSQVQAFIIPPINKALVNSVVEERVSFNTEIYTDEHGAYRHLKHNRKYGHTIVIHSKGEYVRGRAHTNSVENFWSLFKRQIIGQHHFVSVKHLQRYLNECSFKFNNRENADLFALVVLNLVMGTALRYRTLIGKTTSSRSAFLIGGVAISFFRTRSKSALSTARLFTASVTGFIFFLRSVMQFV